MATTPELKMCTMCNEKATVSCKTCLRTQYCSQKSLEEDQPMHGLFCKDEEPFLEVPFYKRALYLRVSGEPRWVMIRVLGHPDNASDHEGFNLNNDSAKEAKLDEQAPVWSTAPVWSRATDCLIQRNYMRARELKDTLEIWEAAGPSRDQNESIAHITRELPRFTTKTSLVIMKKTGVKDCMATYVDMYPWDIRDVVDHFTAWGEPSFQDKPCGLPLAFKETKAGTPAVKLLSTSLEENHPERWVPTYVDGNNAVFTEPLLPLSVRVGMPLRARRYPLFWDTNLHKYPRGLEEFQARDLAIMLFRDRDSENTALFENLGNVLLVRDDRKPIHPSHLRALHQFSFANFPDCDDCDEVNKDAHRKIFDAVTPRAFLDYWGEFVASHVKHERARKARKWTATLSDLERDNIDLENVDAPELIGL